jgi:hypothetical protein
MPSKGRMRRGKAAARMARRPARRARPPIDRLQRGWEATRQALGAAERTMEKRVRGLLKRGRLGAAEAAPLLRELRARAERERRRALSGLNALQAHLERERKALGRNVQGAVRSTLAALDIPSRREIAELTRRVERLSHRLDARRR